MARTSVVPYSEQTSATIEMSIPELDMTSNYAVVKDDASETVVKNISSDITLQELVSFKYSKLDKITTTLDSIYPPSTKNGYQFVVKDEFIQRTTENDGVTVHDDPVVAYLTVRTTNGANIITGAQMLAIVERVLGAALLQTGTTLSTTALDRLMRGATKPASLV